MEATTDPLRFPLEQLAIEVTSHCNLRCEMCSVWRGKHDGPPSDVVRSLLSDARDLGATTFVPCGGEPFMRKDFVELLGEADRLGYERIEVVTNGTLVSRHLDALEELESVQLHVSIDGPESVHDGLRGEGVYRKALAAVEGARARGIRVGISGVLMRPTLESADHVLDLAADLGLEEVSFQPFQPEILGMDVDPSPWLFDNRQRSAVEEGIAALRASARDRGIRIYTDPILDHVPAYCFEGVRPIPPGGCFLPSRFILVDVAGDMYPCFFMRDDVMGNAVAGDRLGDVWHQEMHSALQMLAISSRCPGCLAACSDIATFEGEK